MNIIKLKEELVLDYPEIEGKKIILEKGDKIRIVKEESDSDYYADLNIANTQELYSLALKARNPQELKNIMLKNKDKFHDKKYIDFNKVNWGMIYKNLKESTLEDWLKTKGSVFLKEALEISEETENKIEEADIDIKKMIKDLQGDFSGSNEDQLRGVQLLKGLAISEEPISNEFMKELDKATTEISQKILGGMKEEILSEKI